MAPNELIHPGEGEFSRMNFCCVRFPPSRYIRSVMKTNPAELSRIAEDERAVFLAENEVIVFLRSKTRRFRAEFAAHSKMNSKPIAFGKDKEHLLSARGGTEQLLVHELAFQRSRVRRAEDPLFSVHLRGDNLVADPDVPALTKIFHLGQLRHEGRLERPCAPCYPWRAWRK